MDIKEFKKEIRRLCQMITDKGGNCFGCILRDSIACLSVFDHNIKFIKDSLKKQCQK